MHLQDEIAQTLIRIFQVGGTAKEFLVEIVTNEVQKIGMLTTYGVFMH